MIANIYSVLKNQLIEDVQDLELVDWYLGQFDQIGEDYVTASPAAYIQFFDIPWQDLAQNFQKGQLKFRIYLLSQTAYGNENDILDVNNINHLWLEVQIYKALKGKRYKLSDAIGMNLENDCNIVESISRITSTFHHKLSNLMVTYQDFECTVFDYSAKKEYQEILADLCVITSIE